MLAGESPAMSPAYSTATPAHRPQSVREGSMEAGDEEIDWHHTRMLSLGFFPSISTDQVCVNCVNVACYVDRMLQLAADCALRQTASTC